MDDDATARKRDHNLDRPPVWYLPGPFYQYNEDVKKLAKRAGLRIIDSTLTEDRSYAADESKLPKVTLISAPQVPLANVSEPPQPMTAGASRATIVNGKKGGAS